MNIYHLYFSDSDAVKEKPEVKTIRLVVIGDYGVGKTSLIRRLCRDRFDQEPKTTLSIDCQSTVLQIDPNRCVKLELYDTPGVEQYRNNVEALYKSCHGVVIVYDVSEPYSFSNIGKHLELVRRHLPPYAEVFLLGAKADVVAEERRVMFKEADIYATTHGLSLFETSAKKGHNVNPVFCRLVELLLERLEMGTFDPSTMIINNNNNNNNNNPTKSPVNSAVIDNSIKHSRSLLCCWL